MEALRLNGLDYSQICRSLSEASECADSMAGIDVMSKPEPVTFRRESSIHICEQDGTIEQEFKQELTDLLQTRRTVACLSRCSGLWHTAHVYRSALSSGLF